jgi:hypothetical protein
MAARGELGPDADLALPARQTIVAVQGELSLAQVTARPGQPRAAADGVLGLKRPDMSREPELGVCHDRL